MRISMEKALGKNLIRDFKNVPDLALWEWIGKPVVEAL